jgi:hypothetical protein
MFVGGATVSNVDHLVDFGAFLYSVVQMPTPELRLPARRHLLAH